MVRFIFHVALPYKSDLNRGQTPEVPLHTQFSRSSLQSICSNRRRFMNNPIPIATAKTDSNPRSNPNKRV